MNEYSFLKVPLLARPYLIARRTAFKAVTMTDEKLSRSTKPHYIKQENHLKIPPNIGATFR